MASGNRLNVYQEDDGIVIISMCNGENKFDMDYIEEWHAAIDKVESFTNCRGVITRGEGKFFSTGLDMKWLVKNEPRTLDIYHDKLHSLYLRIITLDIPTVAVINGHAIAEGAFIALVHDFRVMKAGTRAWISWPEVHVKLPMTDVMLDLIRLKLPSGQVQREAVVFGKRFDAETAKSLNLVDAVVPETALMSEAKEVIKNSPGRNVFVDGIVKTMKQDLYKDFVKGGNETKAKM